MADEKKSIFNKLGGKKKAEEEAKALADSKAKAEAARKARKEEALKKEAVAAKAEAVKSKAQADQVKANTEKAKADKAKADIAARANLKESADKAKKLVEKRTEEAAAQKKFMENAAADAAAKAAKAAVVKHTWTNEDTYSSLAFKHYGSIKKPYWMLIYEHNKAIIGDNPNSIKTGTVIEIPPLPEELKNEKK